MNSPVIFLASLGFTDTKLEKCRNDASRLRPHFYDCGIG